MSRKLSGRCSKVLLGATLATSLAAAGQADAQNEMAVSRLPFACAGSSLHAKSSSNAPYSAVATTKFTRLLVDGNRIVRTNTTGYARDSKGRTRIESSPMDATIAPEHVRTMVTIEDPVAGRRYVLHPEMRRADMFDLAAMGVITGEMTGVFTSRAPLEPVEANRSRQSRVGPPSARSVPGPKVAADPTNGSAAGARIISAGPAMASTDMVMYSAMSYPVAMGCGPQSAQELGSPSAPRTVSLGERTIEGIKAAGYRNEVQIAVGAIGNEQPIVIRAEEWYSPELDAVIESNRQDPLSGDTSYRLTQIRRGEPDATLFVVPEGYTVEPVRMPKLERFDMRAPPPEGNERGN